MTNSIRVAIVLLALASPCRAQVWLGVAASGGAAGAAQQEYTTPTQPVEQDEKASIRQLLSQYNCKWVAEMRKIYSDDELRQKAKELHLPAVVIHMAERCPR